jgi:hypothetical protein
MGDVLVEAPCFGAPPSVGLAASVVPLGVEGAGAPNLRNLISLSSSAVGWTTRAGVEDASCASVLPRLVGVLVESG